jgi:hypothetical protein
MASMKLNRSRRMIVGLKACLSIFATDRRERKKGRRFSTSSLVSGTNGTSPHKTTNPSLLVLDLGQYSAQICGFLSNMLTSLDAIYGPLLIGSQTRTMNGSGFTFELT